MVDAIGVLRGMSGMLQRGAPVAGALVDDAARMTDDVARVTDDVSRAFGSRFKSSLRADGTVVVSGCWGDNVYSREDLARLARQADNVVREVRAAPPRLGTDGALPPGITRDVDGILRDKAGRISNGMAPDPDWYQKAKIYQVDVRAFKDSTGNGHGDFRGLAERMDHIDDLGMDAIWNKPHYPRGGKDDGYDIVNYFAIDRLHGTMDDFDAYVAAAHGRGKRVITELVLNHTSDKHPWFQDEIRQLARMTPEERIRFSNANESKYVWNFSHTKAQGPPTLFDETRVIFQDFEPSNWTWNDDAQGWYWHRFFKEQPDLNWDNPKVVDDMFEVVDFWMDRGVDGVRLDAVPYLYERVGRFADGTPFQGENLKETHDAIKMLRAHIDSKYADRMILGEANMPVKELLEYFGKGDEANMLFNFSLMPQLYMSTWFGDKRHMLRGLEQTAKIPKRTQWAVFLRNHDEFTLEKVRTKTRERIWKMFREGVPEQGITADERAPINQGVRLRLNELMGHDDNPVLKRARMEMMHSLMYSQPGSPIMYYGDEIGMGTNRMLNDRDGVRTFMQWNDTLNGGFSTARPEDLMVPAITDAKNGAAAVNVAAQKADPDSVFNRMKAMLAARDQSPALQQGALDIVETGDDGVAAYMRTHGDERVVAVANLTQDVRTSSIAIPTGYRAEPLHGSRAIKPGDISATGMEFQPYEYQWFRLVPEVGGTGTGGVVDAAAGARGSSVFERIRAKLVR